MAGRVLLRQTSGHCHNNTSKRAAELLVGGAATSAAEKATKTQLGAMAATCFLLKVALDTRQTLTLKTQLSTSHPPSRVSSPPMTVSGPAGRVKAPLRGVRARGDPGH